MQLAFMPPGPLRVGCHGTLQTIVENIPFGRGWIGVPVLGHVLKHVPRHMLRHMPDKHVLEHVSMYVLNLMANAVLMT